MVFSDEPNNHFLKTDIFGSKTAPFFFENQHLKRFRANLKNKNTYLYYKGWCVSVCHYFEKC